MQNDFLPFSVTSIEILVYIMPQKRKVWKYGIFTKFDLEIINGTRICVFIAHIADTYNNAPTLASPFISSNVWNVYSFHPFLSPVVISSFSPKPTFWKEIKSLCLCVVSFILKNAKKKIF